MNFVFNMRNAIREILPMQIREPDQVSSLRECANFGAPENDDTIAPLQETTQFQNNLTWIFGNHSVKIGGGLNRINDERDRIFLHNIHFPISQLM